jgi:hypothetical protein
VSLLVLLNLQEIRVRPADFGLDYCDQPIRWAQINGQRTDHGQSPANR